jgi:hypothetical protein
MLFMLLTVDVLVVDVLVVDVLEIDVYGARRKNEGLKLEKNCFMFPGSFDGH